MNIIERIQEQLDMLNISPSKMIKGVGLSSGLYTQWKKGMQKPSLKSLQKISDYLDVPLSYFLQDDLKSKAIKKIGFYWDHEQREKIKADALNARDVSFSQTVIYLSFRLSEARRMFARSIFRAELAPLVTISSSSPLSCSLSSITYLNDGI